MPYTYLYDKRYKSSNSYRAELDKLPTELLKEVTVIKELDGFYTVLILTTSKLSNFSLTRHKFSLKKVFYRPKRAKVYKVMWERK